MESMEKSFIKNHRPRLDEARTLLFHNTDMVKGILNSHNHGSVRISFGKSVECKEQRNIARKIWLNSLEITQELIQVS